MGTASQMLIEGASEGAGGKLLELRVVYQKSRLMANKHYCILTNSGNNQRGSNEAEVAQVTEG